MSMINVIFNARPELLFDALTALNNGLSCRKCVAPLVQTSISTAFNMPRRMGGWMDK
jgi:hypothetical protein